MRIYERPDDFHPSTPTYGKQFLSAPPASLPREPTRPRARPEAAETAHSSVPPSKGKHSMSNDYHQRRHARSYYQGLGQRTNWWYSAMAGRCRRMRLKIRCSSGRADIDAIATRRSGPWPAPSQPWTGNDMDTYADRSRRLTKSRREECRACRRHTTWWRRG